MTQDDLVEATYHSWAFTSTDKLRSIFYEETRAAYIGPDEHLHTHKTLLYTYREVRMPLQDFLWTIGLNEHVLKDRE